MYSVRYYPRIQVTAVGLGMYYRGYGDTPACIISKLLCDENLVPGYTESTLGKTPGI
jgi:hypothetical protein